MLKFNILLRKRAGMTQEELSWCTTTKSTTRRSSLLCLEIIRPDRPDEATFLDLPGCGFLVLAENSVV